MTDQPPERPVMICQTVAELPTALVLGSERIECVSCGTPCWVSPASYKQLKKLDARAWCPVCSSAKLGDATEVRVEAITPEQMQEIRESGR